MSGLRGRVLVERSEMEMMEIEKKENAGVE